MEGRKKLGEQSRLPNWHYGKLTALLTAWMKPVVYVLYALAMARNRQADSHGPRLAERFYDIQFHGRHVVNQDSLSFAHPPSSVLSLRDR